MGDRENICIVQHEPGGRARRGYVFLYTHLGGSDLPVLIRKALERGREVWDDESALAGIIFGESMQESAKGLGGFAISTYLYDFDHDVLVVDCQTRTVGLGEAQTERPPHVHRSWSFDEYLQFTEGELRGLEVRYGAHVQGGGDTEGRSAGPAVKRRAGKPSGARKQRAKGRGGKQ